MVSNSSFLPLDICEGVNVNNFWRLLRMKKCHLLAERGLAWLEHGYFLIWKRFGLALDLEKLARLNHICMRSLINILFIRTLDPH